MLATCCELPDTLNTRSASPGQIWNKHLVANGEGSIKAVFTPQRAFNLDTKVINCTVSDVAVSMAAIWSHPCTPAERKWVAFANEQTSTRPTESESAKPATIAVSRQQGALPAHAQMSSPLSHQVLSSRGGHCSCRVHRDQRGRQVVHHREIEETGLPISNATLSLGDRPCAPTGRRWAHDHRIAKPTPGPETELENSSTHQCDTKVLTGTPATQVKP